MRSREVSRAYNGWLILNSEFLKEHAQILARWGREARRFGLKAPTPHSDDKVHQTIPTYAQFTSDRDKFVSRWQLTVLAGSYLPTPAQAHAPLAGGATGTLPDPSLGTTFFFPTIAPLPDRQELFKMIEEAIQRHRLPKHLDDWSQLMATDNGRGKSITRLARISCSSIIGACYSPATHPPLFGRSADFTMYSGYFCLLTQIRQRIPPESSRRISSKSEKSGALIGTLSRHPSRGCSRTPQTRRR